MPLDGSGTYQPPTPEFPAVPNTTILANDFNQIILDISSALSAAIFRDGQAAFTANQSLGGFKLINLHAGAAPQDAVNFLQVFTDPAFTGTTTDGVKVSGTKLTVTTLTVALPAATSIGELSPGELGSLEGITGNVQQQFIALDADLQGQIDHITGIDLAGKANLAGGNIFSGLQQLLASLADGSTAATQPTIDSSDKIATTRFVNGVAMNAALPAQGALTVGQVPVSDGDSAHWQPITGNPLYLATNLGAL